MGSLSGTKNTSTYTAENKTFFYLSADWNHQLFLCHLKVRWFCSWRKCCSNQEPGDRNSGPAPVSSLALWTWARCGAGGRAGAPHCPLVLTWHTCAPASEGGLGFRHSVLYMSLACYLFFCPRQFINQFTDLVKWEKWLCLLPSCLRDSPKLPVRCSCLRGGSGP